MDRQEAIVCVDDEVVILMALKMELTRHFKGRFRTEIALNAEEALRLIDDLDSENVRVTLMLTDLLMPGIPGDQLVALVKRSHPDIRCILVSGQVDERAMEEAQLNPLLDAFIRKPWRSGQLIESVSRCVGADCP